MQTCVCYLLACIPDAYQTGPRSVVLFVRPFQGEANPNIFFVNHIACLALLKLNLKHHDLAFRREGRRQ